MDQFSAETPSKAMSIHCTSPNLFTQVCQYWVGWPHGKKRRVLCSELFTRYLFLFALYVVQFKNSRLSVILPPLYTRVRTLIDLLSDAHALSERSPRMRHMFYINLFKPQAEFHLKPYSLQTLIEPQATVEEFPKILYFQPLEKEF